MLVKKAGKILTTILIMVIYCIPQLSAQEYVGGLLTGNTVFTPVSNPYIVIEPLIVPEGVTLTIEPGTNVLFMVGMTIRVEGGVLISRGTEEQPILFNAQEDEKWGGINFWFSRTEIDESGEYLNGSILENISINQTTYGLVLSDSAKLFSRNIIITNSDYGVSLQTGSTLHIHSSTIDNCSWGMYIKNSGSNVVNNCTITNGDMGIFFLSDNTSRYNRITNNNLSYNTNIALYMSNGQSNIQYNLIQGNAISYSNIGLYIGNGGTDDMGYNVISMNVVRNNYIGIRLSQNADTLSANLVEMNTTGILLAQAGNNQLINNLIQDNSAWGLTLTDGSNGNLISANSIVSNGNGILLTHKDFKYSIDNLITYNALNNNLNEAFLFESGPQQPLLFNSITGIQSSRIFVNNYESEIIAHDNWWGTTDTTLIDSLIFDVHDMEIYGEVIYKPMLDFPDPESPINRPQHVVKRQVGSLVKVDWISNKETDLAGYKVYYGNENESGFIGSVDVGLDTTYVFDNLSLFDPIAVTAYDDDADGLSDQPEGHESGYTYALAGPYAGVDTVICQGVAFLNNKATALGDQNIQWSTSGDGTFNNTGQLNTTYSPGQNDISSGSVLLSLTLTSSGIVLTDEMELHISGIPFVFAGNDTTVNQHDAHRTLTANAGNYSMIEWESLGDGTFVNANDLIADYQPGENDIATGAVKLILKLWSDCGNHSDTLLLIVVPSYNISGKIIKGDSPVNNGVIVAVRNNTSGSKAVSTEYSMSDGTFNFINLSTGNYYLYALTDPQSDQLWIPTYYAESFKWQSAYLLPLSTDIYDVDIHLLQRNNELPEGDGIIGGYFNYIGKSGDEDSIYNTPWFISNFYQTGSNLGLPASNHVVLLMNTELTRIFAWALTASDGSFRFEDLPYGNYRLWGEKAGYTNSLSPVISLSPANYDVEGIQLTINQMKIEISIPSDEIVNQNIGLYPNPAKDWLWYNGSASEESQAYEIRFVDLSGREIKKTTFNQDPGQASGIINISDLQPGLYIYYVFSDDGTFFTGKITVFR